MESRNYSPNAIEDNDYYTAAERYYIQQNQTTNIVNLCELPLVKRYGKQNLYSMETASTEAYTSQLVVRDNVATPVGSDRLMTVSLPYDGECDTDYENSGSESVQGKVCMVSDGDDDEKNIYKRINTYFPINLHLALYMVIFVITNSAQPLLICLLRQKGGAPNGTYTFLIPTYLAMICVGSYPTKKSIWEESWKYPFMLSGLDIVHQVIEKAGLIWCGPSIYTIASSTNTMFLAMLSRVVLKKRITLLTWLSITLISGSIAVSGMSHIHEIKALQLIGFVLVVTAALVNAYNSILSEDILRQKKIEGPNLVSMMGIISLTIFTVWSLVYTLPQRQKLFDVNSKLNPFDLSSVVTILLMLFVSNFFRSSVYYYIIKEAGSVCCGVLKAIRIVIVVAGSHILFSYTDKSQTMTLSKLISSVICSAGVLLYSIENSGIKKPKGE
ncbi:transporter permease [Babesia ovis]|uniref:Transporter permease n=1 Tax=Babesia ovis TaxID=5869 RepID=A0A9W5T9F7_BABOV|nr:transporter permease [Babesia ovis]